MRKDGDNIQPHGNQCRLRTVFLGEIEYMFALET